MQRLALAITLLCAISCAEQQSSYSNLVKNQGQQGSWTEQLQIAANNRLTIVDEQNTPITNATVLIGQKPGDPFPGNSMNTDASGEVELPAGWKTELPVTIQAPGYITLTYARLSPSAQMIQMHKTEGQSKIEIHGQTTGFTGVQDDDGKIDFGLVIPGLTRESLLSFDLSSIISPENDTISIAGRDVSIPSNVTMPEQSETYIIVPVSLNKPQYRDYVRQPGAYHLNAIHGWFPMDKVVDDVRAGKSFFELINYFQFVSFGSKDVNASMDSHNQDINVNQTVMDSSFNMRAPKFNSQNLMLSLALSEKDGVFSPTDVKKFGPGETQRMKTSSKVASKYALSVLVNNTKKDHETHALSANDVLPINQLLQPIFNILPNILGQDFNQLSFTIQQAGGASPAFLPAIGKPSLSNGQIQLNVPQLPAGLQAIGTYVVYSDILPTGSGSVHSEIRTRLWELWTEGWVSNMTLPQIDFKKVAGHSYRWEVLFLAKDAAAEPTPSIESLDLTTVTHVTRNTLDVK